MNTQEIQTNTSGNITGNALQQVLLNMVNASDITFGSSDNIQYLKLEDIENSQIKLLSIGNTSTDIELKYYNGVKFYAMNFLMMEVADDGISFNSFINTKDINVDGDITLVHNKVIKDNTNQATNYIKFTGTTANPTFEIKTNILNIVSNVITMPDISIIFDARTYITTIGKQDLNIIFDSSTQDVELQLQSGYDIKLNADNNVELDTNNNIKLDADGDIILSATNKITLTANDVVSINTTNHNFNIDSGTANVNISGENINITGNTLVDINKVKLTTVKNSNDVNISNKFILAGFRLSGYIQSIRGFDGTEDILFIDGTNNNLYELIQDLGYYNIKNGIIDFDISDSGAGINVNLSFMYNGDTEEYTFYTQFIWNGSLIEYVSSGSGNAIKLIPLT